jgi:hypothetical protein
MLGYFFDCNTDGPSREPETRPAGDPCVALGVLAWTRLAAVMWSCSRPGRRHGAGIGRRLLAEMESLLKEKGAGEPRAGNAALGAIDGPGLTRRVAASMGTMFADGGANRRSPTWTPTRPAR